MLSQATGLQQNPETTNADAQKGTFFFSKPHVTSVWTCTDLLVATSPSCPSPLALWPLRPTTEGRGEHSAAGDEAWERWARVSWVMEKDEFWDAGSGEAHAGRKLKTTTKLHFSVQNMFAR